jgi:hypothetical protein
MMVLSVFKSSTKESSKHTSHNSATKDSLPFVCGTFLSYGFHTFNIPINKNVSLPSRCYYCLTEPDWVGIEEKLIKECPDVMRYYDLNLKLCPNQIHGSESITPIQKNIRK